MAKDKMCCVVQQIHQARRHQNVHYMKQRLDYASCENLFKKQIPSDHDYFQAEPD